MAKLGINTGSSANDGTGDTLREAGGKINTNFDEVYSTIGDGTTLFTGIVTSITAGNFISVSAATGSVTIAGLANTENVNAESLVVSGVSTLGLITSSNTLGIGTIFTTRLEATGAVIGDTLVGDGSQITGLATTERVVTNSLVVSGITTVGLVTGATSIEVNNLYATKLHGDGSNIVNVQYSEVAGIATFATSSGVSTTLNSNSSVNTSGIITASSFVGNITGNVTGNVTGNITGNVTGNITGNTATATILQTSRSIGGVSFNGSADIDLPGVNVIGDQDTTANAATATALQTARNIGGVSFDGTSSINLPGVNTTGNQDTSGNATTATFATTSGLSTNSTFATTSGVSTYADNAGIATFATTAGIATFATTAGIATYASNAGIASYSPLAGIATFATTAGITTYASNAGIASYAPLAGLSTNSTFAGYATTAGIATYASVAGVSTYAGVSGVSTVSGYATNAGLATVATTANYATNAGLATVATTANYATNAGVATVATNAQGLTGTPNIEVGYVTIGNGINVSGVSTLGIVTGATYYGDGTNLSNVVKINSVQSFQNLEVTGISTLGILTGVQSLTANDLYANNITASTFSGDGSGLTSVTAAASVGLKLDDVFVGGGFTSIDFRYEGEQITTFTGVGNSAIFTTSILASTADTRSNTLVVTGVSTLGIVTNVTSIDVSNLYVNNLTASNIYGNADGSDTVLAVTDDTSTSARRVAFINDNDPGVSNYETVNVGNLTWTPDIGSLSGVTTYFGGRVEVTDVYASGIVSATTLYGDGSNLTGVSTERVVTDSLVVSGLSTMGNVTVTSISGNGSGLTGVTASGTGVIVQDGGSTIGTAGTINFGDNLSVSSLSNGAVTVTASTGVASTDNVSTNSLVVSGVSTLASVTVTSITGNGSGLTGLGTFSGNYNDLSNQPTIPSNTSDLTNDSGFITNNVSGTVTATAFVGDGSGITGVTASGTGIIVQDDGSVIGTAGTINFATNLSVSPISAGIVTVTTTAGSGSTANVSTNTLVVVGVSTLGVVTGADSVQATDFYGKVHGNGGDITGLNATNITSGTLPNNRFPATLPAVDGSQLTGIGTFSRDYNDLSNKPTIPSNTSDLTNDSGYITTVVSGVVTATSFSGDGSNLVDGRWTLGANGSSDYTFTGIGFTQTTNDPDFYLARGRVYEFVNGMDAHGFQIQDTQNGTVGNPYNNGVTNNGTSNGTVTFEVPFNAPDTLYYQCTAHTGMGGTIFIYPALR